MTSGFFNFPSLGENNVKSYILLTQYFLNEEFLIS